MLSNDLPSSRALGRIHAETKEKAWKAALQSATEGPIFMLIFRQDAATWVYPSISNASIKSVLRNAMRKMYQDKTQSIFVERACPSMKQDADETVRYLLHEFEEANTRFGNASYYFIYAVLTEMVAKGYLRDMLQQKLYRGKLIFI